MEKHVVTDWWITQKAEGSYLNGYVDGFGVIFLIKSLDEETNTATAICGSVYRLYRKDMSKCLPIIIDSIGLYKMRIGHTVEIFEIKDNGATFNCHGYHRIPNPKRKIGYDTVWNIWAPTGRFMSVIMSSFDIIEKL